MDDAEALVTIVTTLKKLDPDTQKRVLLAAQTFFRPKVQQMLNEEQCEAVYYAPNGTTKWCSLQKWHSGDHKWDSP